MGVSFVLKTSEFRLYRVILDDQFVGSDADVEGVDFGPTRPFRLSLFRRAEVSEDFHSWAPPLEFHLPIQHDGCRDHYQVRTPNAL